MRHTCLIVLSVFVMFACGLDGEVYAQANAQVGDCDPPNVRVRGKKTFRNNTGQAANDLHFYMYQNDRPNVVVTGAQVSTAGCTSADLTLGTDDGTGNPPPGNHGAQVDLDGCDIPAGGRITVEFSLCMNERNVLKLKDIEFTHDSDPVPNPNPPRRGGWRVDRPFQGGTGGGGPGQGAQEGNGGSGKWIHRICFENDDTRWLVLDTLKILASMTTYADIGDINWAAIAPVVDQNGHPPVCIPPGGRYCYDFQTNGSYVGGHIYFRYRLRVANPGECPGGAARAGSASDEGDEDEEDDVEFGDHPVDEEMSEVLPGLDFYVTTQPTLIQFGGSIPSIPADFFNPGSEPFDGWVWLRGQPLDPGHSNADTVVRRLGEAFLPDNGSVDTVPIELVELQLVSVEPIRVTVGTETTQSLFDVLPGFETTNNFTLPPTRTGVSNDGGASIDTEIIQMSLSSAFPPGMELRGEASDSGGPAGAFGELAFFNLFFRPTPQVPTLPGDSFFNITWRIEPAEGIGQAALVSHNYLGMNEKWFKDRNSIWYFQTPDGRIQDHESDLVIPDAQPLRFEEVTIQAVEDDSGISFNAFIALEALGPVDPALPLLTITTLGTATWEVDNFFDVLYSGTSDPDTACGDSVYSYTRDTDEGGTFTSALCFTPVITFVPVGGGPALTLPDVGPRSVLQSTPHGWSYTPPPRVPAGAGPNFFVSTESPLQWIAPDGTPHTVTAASLPCPEFPMDADGDGDVDHDDFGAFQACYDPQDIRPGCECFDFNEDGRIDKDDFDLFRNCVSGPAVLADPSCAAPLGTIQGRALIDVMDDFGISMALQPLGGMDLLVLSGSAVVASGQTAPDGEYSFPGLPEGSYQVHATAPDGRGATAHVDAAGFRSTLLHFLVLPDTAEGIFASLAGVAVDDSLMSNPDLNGDGVVDLEDLQQARDAGDAALVQVIRQFFGRSVLLVPGMYEAPVTLGSSRYRIGDGAADMGHSVDGSTAGMLYSAGVPTAATLQVMEDIGTGISQNLGPFNFQNDPDDPYFLLIDLDSCRVQHGSLSLRLSGPAFDDVPVRAAYHDGFVVLAPHGYSRYHLMATGVLDPAFPIFGGMVFALGEGCEGPPPDIRCGTRSVSAGNPLCSYGGIACATENAACRSSGRAGVCKTHVWNSACRRCDCK